MKKAILILLALCITVSCCACSQTEVILDTGLDSFVAGRTETPPYMPQSVTDMLDDMLERYSGGVFFPSGTQIDSSEQSQADSLRDRTDGQTLVASSPQILEQILRTAMCETKEGVSIELTGFTVDFDDVSDIVDSIIYTEMIGCMCIESYETSIPAASTGNQVIDIGFNYSLPVERIIQMKTEAEAAAQKAVDNLGLVGKSDIEIAQAVNEYLCDTCVYLDEPYIPEAFTTYGAFVEGACVCDGYARAAQVMFELSGVESMYIYGNTGSVLHAWNMVKVDGQWYHLDVTWNDGSTHRTDYFLVTDDYMKVSRVWDYADYPVTASVNY